MYSVDHSLAVEEIYTTGNSHDIAKKQLDISQAFINGKTIYFVEIRRRDSKECGSETHAEYYESIYCHIIYYRFLPCENQSIFYGLGVYRYRPPC